MERGTKVRLDPEQPFRVEGTPEVILSGTLLIGEAIREVGYEGGGVGVSSEETVWYETPS